MDEISEETQRTYERLLRKHRKALLAYPNVHAVDVGFEFADGEPTGQLALRVHVTDKVPASELRRADRVPEEIDGVPVDVIHYNPTPQLARNVRHNPVIGGIQIMNTSTPGVGTLGMIVLSRRSLRPLAISNHHVMCRTPEVATDIVSQPGTAQPADLLGPVFASDRALDCAVCSLGSRPWSFDIYGIGGPTGTAEARIGMKVMKSGLSSGVTWGRIDGISSAGFTVVPDTAVPAAGEMSLPGDSGSIWMDYTNRAIGLHFAGEGPTDPSERGLGQAHSSGVEQAGCPRVHRRRHRRSVDRRWRSCAGQNTAWRAVLPQRVLPERATEHRQGPGGQDRRTRRLGRVAVADRDAHQPARRRYGAAARHPPGGDRRRRRCRASIGATAGGNDPHDVTRRADRQWPAVTTRQ